MSRYKFAIHCVSELWIVRMLGGIFRFFAFFRLFDAIWRPNTQTNIPESLHLDRSHVTLQICNSLCKWIMNSKDARWNFLIFCLFQTIWCHLAAKCTPIFLKLCTLVDIMICYNFAIHYVSELWIGRMISGILFCPLFRLFDATWWPNAETSIPESLHADRSHVILQVCNSSCKWIINRRDDILLFVVFLTC